ncbi:MAG: hypothetical protein K2N27_04405 [Ruminococcus sp.]|nr:hypothetical protein [Ruminococcus sp.]
MIKKVLCGITAFTMAFALTACNLSSEHNNMVGMDSSDIAESDLPYGATLCELSSSNDDNIKVAVDFDKRYFSDSENNIKYDEIYKIHDYIVAIDTNDHELLKSTYYPGFLEYLCGQYELTADEYIDSFNNMLKTDIGENSSINYINISNCYSADDEDFQAYYQLRDEILTAIGAGEITSRKTIEVGGYTTFEDESGNHQLTNYHQPIIACIYEIDGQIYIF